MGPNHQEPCAPPGGESFRSCQRYGVQGSCLVEQPREATEGSGAVGRAELAGLGLLGQGGHPAHPGPSTRHTVRPPGDGAAVAALGAPPQPEGSAAEARCSTYFEGWREGASLFVHPAPLKEKAAPRYTPHLLLGALAWKAGSPALPPSGREALGEPWTWGSRTGPPRVGCWPAHALGLSEEPAATGRGGGSAQECTCCGEWGRGARSPGVSWGGGCRLQPRERGGGGD